jgi:hypothetical protein
MSASREPAAVLAVVEHRIAMVEGQLHAMGGDLRGINTALTALAEQTKALQDHETRLRQLEKAWWRAAGACVVASALISTAAPALRDTLTQRTAQAQAAPAMPAIGAPPR